MEARDVRFTVFVGGRGKCLHCGEALVYNRGIFMERCYFLIQNKSKQTLICSTVIFVLVLLCT